jgi:RNA polymerase sigma-70 factor, ECF subfamily
MTTDGPEADVGALFELARGGDHDAYGELVEVYRAELHAHCYRILASVHDAEDALQEALLRAWRGLAGFEGRSSVRTWLYKIATNASIDVARGRSKRSLPADDPIAAGGAHPTAPLTESIWLEPYPDHDPDADVEFSPEARYERRESLELAFVAALQHLPPRQRAVLILRDVLGFSAQEVADQLDTSVPAVTSALQRARATTESRLPGRSQQDTLRTLGDDRIRDLASRYSDAIERGDAEMLVSMLTEDAVWAMPPVPSYYRGRAAITEFLVGSVFPQRWRHRATRANGQLAVGCYLFDADERRFVAAVLDVLTLDDDRIAQVDGFLTAGVVGDPNGSFVGSEVFPRFGLPAELPEGPQ